MDALDDDRELEHGEHHVEVEVLDGAARLLGVAGDDLVAGEEAGQVGDALAR